ncbi:hypothetical protein [Bradyrhizobium genosp. A]|uniref:hypothetical protein n=1 Tax=Bradyrhizobium genosp. A TaxID=83626 RepID=UPI003CF41BA8
MSLGRKNSTQQVGYLRFKVNYNDAGIATGNAKQWLPAGAIMLRSNIITTTAFNAATTNTISLGFVGGTGTELVNAQSVTAAADVQVLAPVSSDPLAAPKQIQAIYAQTGAAATAGAAYVVIEFVADNDLNIGQ